MPVIIAVRYNDFAPGYPSGCRYSAPDAPRPYVYDSKCHDYKYSGYACSSEICISCYQPKSLAFYSSLLLIGKSLKKYERPHKRQGLSLALIYCGLFWNYVCRAGSFFTLAHRVINLLPLVKICIPGCLDFRVVNEKVGSTLISSDKPVSFFAIEPFNCS